MNLFRFLKFKVHELMPERNMRCEHNLLMSLVSSSNRFFDFIKVIQNAREVHLIDSIWGALYYQIDSKYGLFSDKEINLHAMRGYKQMFENPVKLKNWNII